MAGVGKSDKSDLPARAGGSAELLFVGSTGTRCSFQARPRQVRGEDAMNSGYSGTRSASLLLALALATTPAATTRCIRSPIST